MTIRFDSLTRCDMPIAASEATAATARSLSAQSALPRAAAKQRGDALLRHMTITAGTATGFMPPAPQLIGFARVALEPGTGTTISFRGTHEPSRLHRSDGWVRHGAKAGGASAGSNLSDILSSAKFSVTGKPRPGHDPITRAAAGPTMRQKGGHHA